jgi:hypothetical protein
VEIGTWQTVQPIMVEAGEALNVFFPRFGSGGAPVRHEALDRWDALGETADTARWDFPRRIFDQEAGFRPTKW